MRQAYQNDSPDSIQITTQNRDTFTLTYKIGLLYLLNKSAGAMGKMITATARVQSQLAI